MRRSHSFLPTVLFSLFLLILFQLPATAQESSGFFRAEGTEIVNGDGDAVLIRGVGLGGWLMPEGYMLHVPGVGSPTSIREMIEDVIGPANTEEFYKMYTANYVAEKDIEAIAAWGFDHIRLPFHYDVFYDIETDSFKEEGFALLDAFMDWCRTYGLYVILDMHAAPGAQSIHNIADSDGVARLWTEPVPYQDLTEKIWVEIATRYVDDTQIIGYDLINEPVTPDEIADGAQALRDLYVRLATAIREVDQNHILFIEGNYFATTFDKLFPPFDDNMVYAFHKYWNATDQGTIQYLVNIRSDHQTPLWLGESGENSNAWFYETVQLMEQNNIGWNWWTHKKINTRTSPLSAPFSEGYQDIIRYWNGQGAKPSEEEATEIMFNLAANLAIDSTQFNPAVVDALFDPDFDTKRRPYKEHVLPGYINAVDYDFGYVGTTYFDRDFKATSGFPAGGNTGGEYRNDGVDIEQSTDPEGFAYNVGWIEQGEWTEYTVMVEQQGTYDVDFRVATANTGRLGFITLSVDGNALGSTPSVPRTGGWQNWTTVSIPGIELAAGEQIIRLFYGTGGYNLNRATFTLVQSTSTETEALPSETRILSHYPNPFRHEVRIPFESATSVDVQLVVFDILGREVYKAPKQAYHQGQHTLSVQPDALPGGTYFYRLYIDSGAESYWIDGQPLVKL